MNLSAIALTGLERASTQFDNAAANLTRAAMPTTDSGADTVDLSTAAVSMLASRNEFEGNIATIKVAGEMEDRAIDMLA